MANPLSVASNSSIVLVDEDGLEGVYKLKSGETYYHPPSDNLKIPIPHGAVRVGKIGAESDKESFSLAMDFMQIYGQYKAAKELVTGKDEFTGEELSWKQRIFGIIPGFGKVKKVSKVLYATKKVSKTEQKILKATARAEK